MAGNTATSEECPPSSESTVNQEIADLKNKFPKHGIKVIRDVGDITHMITVTMNGFGFSVKLQLDEFYPAAKPNVICKSIADETSLMTDNLTLKLNEITSLSEGKPVLAAVISEAEDWVREQNIVCSDTEKEKASPKGKKSKKKGKNKPKQQEEEVVNEKKPPMKTAIDVISRIQWDEGVPADCIIIGYLDRMLGLVEKPFGAFSWEDIATVDYNVLAIPKHRIQYFKYKDVKVWDKKRRLDNVFGSLGGQTILDVIENYQENPTGAASHDNFSNSSSDDDDDDFVIKTGCEEEAAEDNLRGKEVYWGKKARPTHFVAVRLSNPDIVDTIREVHSVIEEIEPAYAACVLPLEKLHITLCCLGLDTEEDVQKAVTVLHKIRPELERFNPSDIKINIADVDHFYHSVLYAKIEENEQFMDFAQQLRMCVKHEGLEIRDVFDFHPHATLLKLKQHNKVELRTNFLDTARLIESFKGKNFGSQMVDGIYLCAMSEEMQADGFYVSPTKVTFSNL